MPTAIPSPRQLEYQDWELGLFLHFGLYAIEGWHEQDQMRRRIPADHHSYVQALAGLQEFGLHIGIRSCRLQGVGTGRVDKGRGGLVGAAPGHIAQEPGAHGGSKIRVNPHGVDMDINNGRAFPAFLGIPGSHAD